MIVRSDSINLSVIADEFKRLEDEGVKAHKSAASSSGLPFFERAVEMR